MADQETAYAGQPIRVGVNSVESELAKQWRMAAEGEGTAVGRVILSNLFVYSATSDDAEEAMAVIADIIAGHPSRAVVVDEDPEKQEGAGQAEVAMICSIGERGRRLCGEVIRIHAHGVSDAVFGTILPVMIPELPTFLWNPSDLKWDRGFLRRLLQVSDQWIIDSRKFANMAENFALVELLVTSDQPSIVVQDLPWVSLGGWREAIARNFDPPAARSYLHGVKKVEIACRSMANGAPDIEALLLVAWLNCRLGWKFAGIEREDKSWIVRNMSDAGDVLVSLKPQDMPYPLKGVRIESGCSGRHATFSADLIESGDGVSIDVDAPDVAKVPYTGRLIAASLREEVSQVLNGPTGDVLYKQMLPVLRSMADGISTF